MLSKYKFIQFDYNFEQVGNGERCCTEEFIELVLFGSLLVMLDHIFILVVANSFQVGKYDGAFF